MNDTNHQTSCKYGCWINTRGEHLTPDLINDAALEPIATFDYTCPNGEVVTIALARLDNEVLRRSEPRRKPIPGKVVECSDVENQVSAFCDNLIAVTPGQCARELIFQIRSLAGAGKYTWNGGRQNGGEIH
jgi:hypothetical protein